MSALLDRINNPATVPMGTESDREAAAYDSTATIFQEWGEEFLPLQDHENIKCRVYPYSYGQGMPKFDTTRLVTDRIKLQGFYPRINSSHFARATGAGGESVMFAVHDIEEDGDKMNTSLIVRRRGVDKS